MRGLGQQELDLKQGRLAYRDRGSGPPVVFVHGLLVDSTIWDATADALLGDGYRCIQPELPMGSHRIGLREDADNSPPGVANTLGGFLMALELEEAILVGNDSGGAICQLLAARDPRRIGGMVLTNCDIGHAFPPFPYSVLPPLARIPGGTRLITASLGTRLGRRMAYRNLTLQPIPSAVTRGWVEPSLRIPAVRRDLRKLVAGARKTQTLQAAEALRRFEPPVLFAWAVEDRLFKLELAEWLSRSLPNSRIETIADARTFVMLDQPKRLARLIADHADRVAARDAESV